MTKRFKTPAAAEAAFYEAVERTDLEALGEIWSIDQNIVCIHPGSFRIEGRSAVLESFAQLFLDAPVLDFQVVDVLQAGNDGLAVHLVREEIAIDGRLASVMVSTNIYHVEHGGWRMLLHHASYESGGVVVDDETSDQKPDAQTLGVSPFDELPFDDNDEEDGGRNDEHERPPVLH